MDEEGRTAPLQDPPGVLKPPPIGRFQTVDEEIARAPLEDIQPLSVIPEYLDPTDSSLPFVVRSPVGCFCIDGWNLVEEAKAAGNESIRCHIFHIEDHSVVELAIRKVAIRIRPQGGPCSYAERVRNTFLLNQILLEKCENPIVHSHGGARRGTAFSGNREDDVRAILAERLGKSRSTFNQYLAHGRHLSADVLEALVANGIKKRILRIHPAGQEPLHSRIRDCTEAHGRDYRSGFGTRPRMGKELPYADTGRSPSFSICPGSCWPQSR